MMKQGYIGIGECFAGLVREYIDVIDHQTDLERIEFLLKVHRLLSRIYAKAAELPTIKETDDELHTQALQRGQLFDPTNRAKQFFEQKEQVGKLLGESDRYWHLFDPLDEKEKDDPVQYCISGDLSEVYESLEFGLQLWDMEDARQKELAIYFWHYFFDIEWGHHAVISLRVMHRLIEEFFLDYDGDDFDEIRNKGLEKK